MDRLRDTSRPANVADVHFVDLRHTRIVAESVAYDTVAALTDDAVADFAVAFVVDQDSSCPGCHRIWTVVGWTVPVANTGVATDCPIVEAVDSLFRQHFGHVRASVFCRRNRVGLVAVTIQEKEKNNILAGILVYAMWFWERI